MAPSTRAPAKTETKESWANVKILKELIRRGKKEKEIIDEVPYTF